MNKRILYSIYISLIIILFFNVSCTNDKTHYIVKLERLKLQNKNVVFPRIYKINKSDTIYLKNLTEKIREEINIIDEAPLDADKYYDFAHSTGYYDAPVGYLDLDFQYEISDRVLHLKFSGSYVDKQGRPMSEVYLIDKSDELFVDLQEERILSLSDYESDMNLKYFFEPENYL